MARHFVLTHEYAAIAKAAAARYAQDNTDDDLPFRVIFENEVASQAPDLLDLPVYHRPS